MNLIFNAGSAKNSK